MKNLFYIFLSVFLISCSAKRSVEKITAEEAQNYLGLAVWMVEITEFQKELINEWNDPETTPLHDEEKADFKGITFFPMDIQYKVNAEFTPMPEGKTLPFPTSAGLTKYYKEYGKVIFILDGKEMELTLYQSDPPFEELPNHLFLPFMDDTNGDTTYGGGRYMDLDISDIQNGKIVLDFNKAYNPYCAYSNHYNCPISPRNNYLETEVKAGVSYLQ